MEENPLTRTAGIIIIGNEILSGKVQDTNSFFLATELRALGVSVRRIVVIPDEIEDIGREAARCSAGFDFAFTSGGVGPTHDDLTMEGIARGFGVRTVMHPVLQEKFRLRYGECANEAIMKMALVPDGAEIIDFGADRFPLVAFRNIYVFPGIPRFLREKFLLIRDRFRAPSFYITRIFINAEEPEIAACLNSVVALYPVISFGSYPVIDCPDYKVIVTAESKDEGLLRKAVGELLGALPEQIVVRIQ